MYGGLADLYPPNILAEFSKETADSPNLEPHPVGDFHGSADRLTAGCRLRKGLWPGTDVRLMQQSRFGIHIRGGDASSSRMYQAITTGLPQLGAG
eukprot:jgi/Tetstr1/439439/TSEL_027873.t1